MSDLPEGVPTPQIPSGVGEGWHPIVAECHKKLLELDPDYRIDQIKEKFGMLRYYFTPSEKPGEEGNETYEKMEAVVSEAEKASGTICEWCGEPGRTVANSRGWIKTLCDNHREEDNKGVRWKP